jgi:hypothetical protein
MTPSFRTVTTSALLTGALVAGSLFVGTAANAAEVNAPASSSAAAAATDALQSFSPAQLDEAIAEAQETGHVTKQVTGADGSRTTTIDLGEGFTFDIVQGDTRDRLSAGSDGYGTWVGFSSADQSAIISGAGWALGAGVCAISAGTFCVVAGAIIAAATWAVSTYGLRCGNKVMRVYPFSGHDPRCA